MENSRELIVLFCLCEMLDRQRVEIEKTGVIPIREEIVLLTCQYGRKFKVQPWEVDYILDNSVSRLLFGK